MAFHTVEPEVAGELGPRTEYDRSTRPPGVTRLEYVFTGWLGDPLVESTPCFLVSETLGERLEAAGLVGFRLDDVVVSTSPEGDELIDRELPRWRWLRLTGSPGHDDFGVNDDVVLVVSSRALGLLRRAGLENADVDELRVTP